MLVQHRGDFQVFKFSFVVKRKSSTSNLIANFFVNG